MENIQAQEILIDDIFIDPATRTRVGGPTSAAVKKLAEVFAHSEQHTPIKIAPPFSPAAIESGKPYQLVFGETRLRAREVAGSATVLAIVSDAIDTPAALLMGTSENVSRDDLTPTQKIAAYQRLIHEAGLSAKEVATHFGISPTEISHARAVAKQIERFAALGLDLATALDAGKIGLYPIRDIAKLADGPALKLFGRVLDGEMTPSAAVAKAQVILTNLAQAADAASGASGAGDGDGDNPEAPEDKPKKKKTKAMKLNGVVAVLGDWDTDGEGTKLPTAMVSRYLKLMIAGKITPDRAMESINQTLTVSAEMAEWERVKSEKKTQKEKKAA